MVLDYGVCSASKAVVNSLVKILSAELAPRGVRVNAVSPGPVNTPLYGKIGTPPEQLETFAGQLQSQVPVERFGDPSEIAKTVAFLASPDASFVVGANLAADGGVSLQTGLGSSLLRFVRTGSAELYIDPIR